MCETGWARSAIVAALSIDTNNLDALFFSSMVCMALGCFDEAIEYIQRAAQLDPLWSEVQSEFG
jgi:tetratricopeptide (TPR) repeat protein